MTREADADPRLRARRLARLGVAALVAQALVGIAVPAGLGWDFANFYDAGRRVAAGQAADLFDPDSAIAGERPQGGLAFWSAPISAWLYAPLGPLAPETALVVFKLQNTLALFAALALLYAFSRRFESGDPAARGRFAALFAFACLLYQPLWTVYRVGGQTTPTVLLLLSLGLVCHVREQLGLSALCWVASVLIKPALAPALALLALLAGLRFALAAALALAAAGALSLAAMGWEIHVAFVRQLLGGAGATWPWPWNSSLYVPIESARSLLAQAPDAPVPALAALTAALQLGVVALVALLAWSSRGEPWSAAARRHFQFQLALLFFLLVSTTVWEHYLSLLLPFLVYLVASRERLSRSARRVLVALFALAPAQNLIVTLFLRDHFGFESPPALAAISLFKSAPLLLTCWLLIRHRREIFDTHRAPAWATLGAAGP